MERFIENKNINESELMEKQASFLREAGIWTYADFDKFKFRLSPDVMELSTNELENIKRVAKLLSCEGGLIEGTIALFNRARDPRFTGSEPGSTIRRVLTANLSANDLALSNLELNSGSITRLDLVKVKNPEDNSPSFQIVEMEGDKTHAFGYVTFPKLIRNIAFGETNRLGIIDAFKNELAFRKIDPEKPVLLIVARSEVFYLKELKAFSEIARKTGLNIFTVEEQEVEIVDSGVKIRGKSIQSNVLVNIPKLTPSGIFGTGVDSKALLESFSKGKITSLIPPLRFLSNKGVLGLIKNSLKEPLLERVLLEVFDPTTLANIREFIPETVAVSKRNKNKVIELLRNEPENWVIKEVSSSGMRGISLSGVDNEKTKREKMINQIEQSPFNFIIQKKIDQESRPFRFTEPVLFGKIGEIKSADMFLRVSPFVDKNGLVEIGVTARESKAVHGSTDSIQIPVLFK